MNAIPLLAPLVSQDCQLCGEAAPAILCEPCRGRLPHRHGPSCPQCGEVGVDAVRCGACLADAPHFDVTVSAFQYAFPLDRLLQSYKFNANLALTDLFADALAARLCDRGNLPDLVVPLPLARKRLAERGFNQSAQLGKAVARRLSLPFEPHGLLRVRETAPQAGLSRAERLKNVKGAFGCERSLTGRRVALIDDVMTTGATLSDAARALKKQGAAQVEAWVIARVTTHPNA
jgi:ComF family protein